MVGGSVNSSWVNVAVACKDLRVRNVVGGGEAVVGETVRKIGGACHAAGVAQGCALVA